MKPTFVISGILVSLFICSCQKAGKANEQTRSQTVPTSPKADEIIRDTVTNQAGVKLAMAFDNAAQTATFVLQGEIITLKQDRMASGIKYSNPRYEFTEHQGEGLLKKGGNVIFSYEK